MSCQCGWFESLRILHLTALYDLSVSFELIWVLGWLPLNLPSSGLVLEMKQRIFVLFTTTEKLERENFDVSP